MLHGTLASFVLVAAATAQGGDTCAVATPITGTGNFTWDNLAAGTSNFDGGGPPCFSFPGTNPPADGPVTFDVFLQWTADTAGSFVFDTEGSAILDTKMSLHFGNGCSAVCLVSHDDVVPDPNSPYLFSRVLIQGVSVGDQLLVQVGCWDPTIAPGAGVLNVTAAPPVPTNDTCASAQAISGTGAFTFDNTTATASGFDGGNPCFSPNGVNAPLDNQITRDVFFQWTPTTAGDFVIDTRGSTGLLDSKLNVHSGVGCTATCLAFNDNVFPFQNPPTFPTELTSRVRVFGASPGDNYLIQLGSWADSQSFGAGVLNISDDPCEDLGDDAFEDNDTCATAVSVGNIAIPYGGLQVHRGDPDFYAVTVPAGSTLDVTIEHFVNEIHLQAATWIDVFCVDTPDDITGFLSAETSIGFDDAFLTWSNTTTIDRELIIRVDHWNVSGTSDCANYGMTITGVAEPASNINLVCDPASDHHEGDYVRLDSSTLGTTAPSGLHIEATNGPDGEFGFILMSADGSVMLPVFEGVLCLGSPQGRYNPTIANNQGLPQLNSIGQFDAAGVLQNIVGTATSTGGTGFDVPSELPLTPAGQVISTGDTLYFQCWFRDEDAGGNPSANFSNVIEVTFP